MSQKVHEDISIDAYSDGEFAITVPFHAMLDMALKQISADELAGKLLENEEVRVEIAKTLLQYPANDMSASDWHTMRKSLGEVAVDELIKDISGRVADLEGMHSKLYSYYRDCTKTLEHFQHWLDAPKALTEQAAGALKRLNETYWGNAEPFKVLGEEWHQVRVHWREQMKAQILSKEKSDA